MYKLGLMKNMNLSFIVQVVLRSFLSFYVMKENLICFGLSDSKFLVDFSVFLKLNFYMQFLQLVDIYGVDLLNMGSDKSFEVKYIFLSLNYNTSLMVSVILSLYETLMSLFNLYPSGIWLEREIWDMYGMFFFNHPDLSSILTDYGFMGHPLSKDFPLVGFVEVSYDERIRSVIIEPVELMQEISVFNKKDSSW